MKAIRGGKTKNDKIDSFKMVARRFSKNVLAVQ